MPLIKDLIRIPEQVNRGDFVLNLIDGVQHPEATAANYVVTPQLADAFANALGFLKSVFATPGGSSKAAYLHGSFGSGKSHFMAILSLLLQGHDAVRNLPRLQPVVASHGWAAGKKFLLVPLHLLNKASMEHGILGGYADFIRRRHPEAPLPAFFRAREVIANAESLRATMGDEPFFAALNAGRGGGSGGDGGWGDWDGHWTAESFAAAAAQQPLQEDCRRLVGDIVQHLLPALRSQGDYVPLDEGLVALAHHAKDLGYGGVILFLDELVLWLMSRAADPQFVGREGPKLAALVEGRIAHAPIPVVSFVARQRDLREALGENLTGQSQQAMSNTMDWWEERFHTIVLEDRNLPVIAQERLLKPVSVQAKARIDEAFARTAANRQDVMDVLLTTGGTKEQFRELYPFSPALIQVLVAVSGALQRERTALRILLQILCVQRERLELGQVVPVGDLWDIIAAGEEVFSPQMRKVMEDAKRLWRETLLPLIREELKLPPDFDPAAPEAQANPLLGAFTQRARIAKTLLLTAIVPGVESLRNLTVRRLAALNHGVITSPIPRQEARTVLQWLKAWQLQCGQIKINDASNDPVVALELSDVDTDAIIRQARSEDNEGNRKRLIMQLLFTEMGIPLENRVNLMHEVAWRGTARQVEIRYLNVREANVEQLRSGPDTWVVVIDYPFDEPGKSPSDDKANIEGVRGRLRAGSKTLIWLPNHLSPQALRDLGDLVIINYLLSGTRLDGYTSHLNSLEKQEAKKVLETRRSALERRVLNTLETAYGVSAAMEQAIQRILEGPADQLFSLEPGFIPQNTDKTTLREALVALVHQALEHQYPLHPDFSVPVRKAQLKRIAEYVSEAVADPRHRTERVDRTHRDIMAGIAAPLRLGSGNDNVFHFGREWIEHFDRCMQQKGVQVPTVRELREWCDLPRPRGLAQDVADLVIWTYAQQSDRRFYRGTVPVTVAFDQLEADMDLRAQALPDEALWRTAQDRAGAVFGYPGDRLRNSATVARLAAAIRGWERERRAAAIELVAALDGIARALGVDATAPRLATAKVASDWLNAVARAGDDAVVETFARTPVERDLRAIASSTADAKAVADAVKAHSWHTLITLAGGTSSVATRAGVLLERLREHVAREQRENNLAVAVEEVAAEVPVLRMQYDREIPAQRPAVDDAAERRRRDAEAERLRQEDERLRAERERLRQEEERLRREREQRAEEERRRREALRPVEVSAAESGTALTQVGRRIAELAKANPGKRLRITIEVVDP